MILMSPAIVSAQTIFPIDSASHKINYTAVVKDSVSKDILFNRALEWFALTFKSSNDVIQFKDKDVGKIVGKWNIKYSDRMGFVACNIIILVKDFKYKYSITDLYYLGTSEFQPWALEDDPGIFKSNMTKGAQHKIKALADQSIKNLIVSLNDYMKSSSSSTNF